MCGSTLRADYTYRASPLDFTAFALKGYDRPV